MQSRREFLDMMAKGTGAACLAGLALGATAADNAVTAGAAPGLGGLLAVLEKAGKSAQVVTNPDGTRVLLLPYGGRVLGLFAPGNDENFYWTHPALSAADTAGVFYSGKDWQNSGGDRTWLAPEVDIFLPKYPDTKTYWQPRELDPGNYEAVPSKDGVQLVNRLTLRLSRSGKEISLRIAKSVGPAPNPLRYEKGIDLGIIKKKGAWLDYNGICIGHGKNDATKQLPMKPELLATLSSEISTGKAKEPAPNQTEQIPAPVALDLPPIAIETPDTNAFNNPALSLA